mmetsp:Transcript_37856/g.96919  ORF Transcript_37856/g.96919 Transcript_37856/m.96919 type:complete len:270 (-) Transcript_37856:780-1589(-)
MPSQTTHSPTPMPAATERSPPLAEVRRQPALCRGMWGGHAQIKHPPPRGVLCSSSTSTFAPPEDLARERHGVRMAFMTSKMPIRKYGKRRSVALTLAASHKFRDTPRNEVVILRERSPISGILEEVVQQMAGVESARAAELIALGAVYLGEQVPGGADGKIKWRRALAVADVKAPGSYLVAEGQWLGVHPRPKRYPISTATDWCDRPCARPSCLSVHVGYKCSGLVGSWAICPSSYQHNGYCGAHIGSSEFCIWMPISWCSISLPACLA